MDRGKPDTAKEEVLKYQRKVLSSWRLRLYYGMRLPTLAWWGVRVVCLDRQRCVVSISHRYRTKNPFRSIYFGALAGAGELATGILCQQAIVGRGDVSMLVTAVRATFSKKAKGRILFTCEGGRSIAQVMEEVIRSNESRQIRVESIGLDTEGDVVATFEFTWSFKRRER